MAEVYDYPDGEKLEHLMARHLKVQAKLDQVTLKAALKAESILSEHRETGNARIGIERAHKGLDWFVYLEDPDVVITDSDGNAHIQPGAANIIEWGRPDGDNGDMKGLRPLSRAFGVRFGA